MSSDTVFPSSFVQRRLWFLHAMAPASTAYNMVLPIELPYVPDTRALQGALDDLVARHEPLRTRFAYERGEPVQVVAPTGQLPLQVRDLRLDPSTARRELNRCLSSLVAEPFDLARGPLVRAMLGLVGADHAVFALVVHHIVVDARSARILIEELDALYRARAAGTVALLPEAPVQYGDFAAWQRQVLSSRRLDVLIEYWRDRLNGLAEIDLAPHRSRSTTGGGRGAVHPFSIPPDLIRGLKLVSAHAQTTLFATLLSAWSVLLGRFTGDRELPIGIPVSGRPKPELERVVGPFVNSVVMRVDLTGEPTFRQLLDRTSAALAEALTHQDLPFELLVERLQWPRRANRNPIFQMMFQLQVRDRQRPSLGSAGAADLAPDPGPGYLETDALTSQLDLSCIQYETADDGIEGGIVYATELLDDGSIGRLVDGYLCLLADAARRPSAPIAELHVMNDSLREVVWATSEGERRHWPDERLDTWFARQAPSFVDRLAIVADTADRCSHLTFGELAAAANGYAAALVQVGVTRGRIVGIALPRGPELVAAVLGVLQAGAAYVYLDANVPAERRAFILADCDAAAVVVRPGDEGFAFERPRVVTDQVEPRQKGIHLPDTAGDDPAYVIYTSGSTGEPKGVVIPHSAIANHMHWMLDRFPLASDDRVLQRTPLTFDASVWELFAPILAGSALVLASDRPAFDPVQLGDVIRKHRITVLQVVPSVLRALLASNQLGSCGSLRRIFCGGEPLTPELRDAMFAASSAELCNLYGPSETTIDATFHLCDRADRRTFVPIGRPIANAVARVLDERGAPVPFGVAGELYVGGAPVGTGYLNRPELTAERFVHAPDGRGGRLFRTGDRVRLLATGELEILGRLDDQVKVRGFRIELGEIESVLARHPSVADAAAVVQEHGSDDSRLAAFVVARVDGSSAGTVPTAAELRAWLRERLPGHLVPSAVAVVASLPRTQHGKVDRAALRRAEVGRPEAVGAAAPRNDLERAVCRAFQETLGVPVVGLDDNFFDLGGHSLLVLPLREWLITATDRRVEVVDLFEHPTPRQLARMLGSRPPGRHPSTLGA